MARRVTRVGCAAGFGGKSEELQVSWLEPGALRETREHARTDSFSVVKREDDIRPAGTRKRLVRTGLALECPAESVEGCEDTRGLGRRSETHAAAIAIEMG
jgi:hypothetical protein